MLQDSIFVIQIQENLGSVGSGRVGRSVGPSRRKLSCRGRLPEVRKGALLFGHGACTVSCSSVSGARETGAKTWAQMPTAERAVQSVGPSVGLLGALGSLS